MTSGSRYALLDAHTGGAGVSAGLRLALALLAPPDTRAERRERRGRVPRLRLDFLGRGVPCGFVSLRHAGAAWRHRRWHNHPRHLRVGVRGALALPLRRCQALHAYAVQPPRREIFHEDLVHSALPLDGRLAVKPREGTVWG